MSTTAASTIPTPNPIPQRLAMTGLVALSLLNLLNYLDRYVVSALVESLKASSLALKDYQLGLLMTGFLVVYTVAAPLFGSLGDRGRRTHVLAIGAVIWSVATSLSGLAQNFIGLFLARATVGVGEAAYVTVSASLLADYFPRDRRSRAFAVFYMAIPVGSALGYVFGGLVDKHYGWRAAFYMAGLPGLLLALWVWRLYDPPRGIQGEEVVVRTIAERPWAKYARFIRNRSYRFVVLGYAAYTFAVGGLAFWMPAFLERIRGLPRTQATVGFGAVVVVTGLLGTFAGGWIGDHFLKRTKQAYCWVSAISVALAIPFVVVALAASTPMIYFPAIAIGQFLLFVSTSPINTAVINYVAPEDRASAMALCVFAIHALGDVFSPPLIGAVADYSSLGTAVFLVPFAIVVAAFCWFRAALIRT
jgi:MFS transporter, Spinster family, sphingosine-1-phosphate transporter